MGSIAKSTSEQDDIYEGDIFHINVVRNPEDFLEETDRERNKLLEEESERIGVVNEVKYHKGVQELVKEVDSWYSWLVVFASFLSCFVVGVLFISFSLLYLEFVEYFEAERGPVGWIGSMYLSVGNFFGIILSVVIQYYGCRVLGIIGSLIWTFGFVSSAFVTNITVLYFTYGLLGGIGFNTVILSSFVIVQQHFVKHRSLAAGLSACGISVGSLSSGPIIGFFIRHYGWRGTLIMMGGLSIHCLIFALFYRPPRMIKPAILTITDAHETESKETTATKHQPPPKKLLPLLKKLVKDMSDLSLFRNERFVSICLATVCFNFGASIFYQHTPSRAVSFGVSKEFSYYITTIVGIVTLLARLMGAAVGNMACTDRVMEYGFAVVLGGVFMLLTGLTDQYYNICIIAAFTGFAAGLTMTIQTTVTSDIVGVSLVHRAQAFINIFMGFGALVGVPLAGIMYDKTKNYNLPFYCGGVFQMFGGVLLLCTHVMMKFKKAKSKHQLKPIVA